MIPNFDKEVVSGTIKEDYSDALGSIKDFEISYAEACVLLDTDATDLHFLKRVVIKIEPDMVVIDHELTEQEMQSPDIKLKLEVDSDKLIQKLVKDPVKIHVSLTRDPELAPSLLNAGIMFCISDISAKTK